MEIQCSFCGQGQEQVTKLIEGPEMHICAGCVQVCYEIMRKADALSPYDNCDQAMQDIKMLSALHDGGKLTNEEFTTKLKASLPPSNRG